MSLLLPTIALGGERPTEVMSERLRDTRYQALSDSYELRDRETAKRLIEVVRENVGRRIIALTGADHRVFAEVRLEEALGKEVTIVPVAEPSTESD